MHRRSKQRVPSISQSIVWLPLQVRQLRSLYSKIRELLSFDLLSQLPPELSEMIFSYLDVLSLCTVAQCCRSWRDMSNKDTLWYFCVRADVVEYVESPILYVHTCRFELCKRKGFVKYSNLSSPAWTEHNRPTSPRHKVPPLFPLKSPIHPPPCKWRQVYMKAHTLGRHWSVGVYSVAPLLRGHRQRVTCISCEG